ncbi:MAG: hypothetical protein ACREOI_36420, partial [bacterium]
PGMTAQVKLQLDVLPDATIIPIGCVFEVDGQPVVFTKNSPKKPVPVKLGARDDFNISVENLEAGTEISWQTGTAEAQPLGYAEFQRRLRRPPSEYQTFFTEMEKRQLTFDYEAYRHRPPEPPGGAPGGTEAMLKKFGFPSGEMATKSGQITLTPEMMKSMQKADGANNKIMGDSAGVSKKLPSGEKHEAMIFHGKPETAKIDSVKIKRPN